MRRFSLLYIAPTLLILTVAAWPLISGSGTLYTRDVLTGHFPMKVSQAEALRSGELPLVDPYRAGGQPLLGNPNALPLYPDNLLYLVAHNLWALNAHFWLHLLIAPFAGFWLGRAWGLGRPAAWAVGVCYASSGFFLSLMNLYNLVAGAALAPAFLAACLTSNVVAAGLLWALLLLAGDPFFAALTLALAVTAVLFRRLRRRDLRLAEAIACGTFLAAPMIVEMLRILPLSFRGYWQYSPAAALAQSWDPRSALEWLLPFFFGRPDFTFWGQRFFGGNPPLFYSLYPGLPALVLVALAGLPRYPTLSSASEDLPHDPFSLRSLSASGRFGLRNGWVGEGSGVRAARAWAWLVLVGGLFFALGAWNPVVRLLFHLPGAAVLRYPVKLWLAVAIAAALLCGLGFERLLDVLRRYGVAPRATKCILGLLAVLYATALWLFIRLPEPVAEGLRGLDPQRLAGPLLERQRLDWAWLSLLSLAVLALLALILRIARKSPSGAGALLLGTHLAAQLFLLQPLYDSDDVTYYTARPAALAEISEGSVAVHGGQGDLFGRVAGSPVELFPDPRFFWLARAHFAQLYPFSGIQWGRRYALNHSPEGLDTFFVISLADATKQMTDPARIRILEAAGVDVLLLDRELAPEARGLAELAAHHPASPQRPSTSLDALDLYVYRLPRATPEVHLATEVRRAPHMNRALELLTEPSFDPWRMVVLPGDEASGKDPGSSADPAIGRVEILRDGTEELEARVSSEAGGVLVTRRAFLDLYRATVDGRPVTPVVANLHLLAVGVPPGEHRVRLWADRRPTMAAFAAAFLGAAGLGFLGIAARRRPPGSEGSLE